MQIRVVESRAYSDDLTTMALSTVGGILRVLRPRFYPLRAPSAKIDQIDIPMEKIHSWER